MITEKELGKQQHAYLKQRIIDEFPNLTSGQKWYVQNKISQILRRCKCDVIQIWVSNKSFSYCQYEQSHEFIVGGKTKVYMNIQVD